jgi:hypothetical protein
MFNFRLQPEQTKTEYYLITVNRASILKSTRVMLQQYIRPNLVKHSLRLRYNRRHSAHTAPMSCMLWQGDSRKSKILSGQLLWWQVQLKQIALMVKSVRIINNLSTYISVHNKRLERLTMCADSCVNVTGYSYTDVTYVLLGTSSP